MGAVKTQHKKESTLHLSPGEYRARVIHSQNVPTHKQQVRNRSSRQTGALAGNQRGPFWVTRPDNNNNRRAEKEFYRFKRSGFHTGQQEAATAWRVAMQWEVCWADKGPDL